MTQAIYEIIVGNVGRVAEGTLPDKALSVFNAYVKASRQGQGACAGEPVVLLRNGEIVREWEGTSHG